MDLPLSTIEIPASRIIANRIATVLFLVIFGAILTGLGSLAGSFEWSPATPHRYVTLRFTGVGIEIEFPSLKPHPPGAGGFEHAQGPAFLGFAWQYKFWEWRNAAVRWRTTMLGLPWWPATGLLSRKAPLPNPLPNRPASIAPRNRANAPIARSAATTSRASPVEFRNAEPSASR